MRTCVRVPSPYTELHLHSAYSFLDGASMPDEIVPKALELGHDAVALTDHNSLSGSMEFAQHAKALGLRALHGAEANLTAAATSPLPCATPPAGATPARCLPPPPP